MNQIQIGRFIAASRKARNLTQRQLADKLGISDKTVSKWEERFALKEAVGASFHMIVVKRREIFF